MQIDSQEHDFRSSPNTRQVKLRESLGNGLPWSSVKANANVPSECFEKS